MADFRPDDGTSAQTGCDGPAPVMAACRRVLVADDDPVARHVVSSALASADCEVLLATDGLGALQLFASRQPDCVLLDVTMPGHDGYEVCRQIRASPGGAELPILILTSHDEIEAVTRAYDAGATDFLAKGFSRRLLTERVRFLLREYDMRRALRISQGRLQAVQAMARVGHWELDRDGRTIDLSDTVGSILGAAGAAAAVTGGLGALRDALRIDDRPGLDCAIDAWRRGGEPFRLDGRLLAGAYVHIQGASTSVAPSGDASLTLAIQDVTLLRQAQREAHRLAFYDSLTGLPNRRRFIEGLDVTIGVRRRSLSLAVLAIRLLGLERLLESAGQAAADRMTIVAAQRLRAACAGPAAPGRVLAHLGGGDFALALPDCDSASAAALVAEDLLDAMRAPLESGVWSVNLLTQVGIALWPQDEMTADALLANARATAGKRGPGQGSGYAFFTPEILVRARRRMELEAALRGALGRDEFQLVYQPRVELDDLRVTGAEALLRWTHPDLGEVGPLEFIPVAEECGLITEIGDWTLRQACRQAAAWRRSLRRAISVSVNVSSQQLAAPRRLLESVQSVLRETGLPANALELELTESMVIHAGPEVLQMLEDVRRLGVSVALDDFGTGYSSLGYLRKLPVDCLKIDRAFVSDLAEDASAEGVLEAILAVARALRLRTVAEGVETVAQYRLLSAQGCREGQGYLFSRPLDPEDLGAVLAGRSLPGMPALLSDTG